MDGFCGIVYKDADRNIVHLPLNETVISVAIVDVSARVSVTQVYGNDLDTPTPRCKYVFPVPARAAVCAFSMVRLDRNLIYGVAKEKGRAQEEYEAGVREGNFAGLVDWVSDDVFTITLGSIPANQTVTIRTVFVTDLMNEELSDKVRLQLPLSLGKRHGPIPEGLEDATSITDKTKLKITVEVQTNGDILSVTSPSHEIELEGYKTHHGRPSRRRKIAKLHSKTFLDRDFILVVQADGLDLPRCFMERDTGGGTVALQLTLIPKFDLPPIARQEYIFLVDRSGSMNSDQRMDVAKESLALLIRCLPGTDTLLNIFSFGTGCSSLWKQSVPYNEQNLTLAAKHIGKMEANMGGTEMRGALDSIFSSRNRTNPTVVLMMTDGEVTKEGPVKDVVVNAVSRSLQDAPVRLFILGIGLQTSTSVCENLARAGNGEYLMATTSEAILSKCTTLLRAGRTSKIEDVSIDWGVAPDRGSGVQINWPDAVQQSPPMIKHLYPHSRFLVYAILDAKNAPKKVKIRGKINGGKDIDLEVKVESVKFGKDRKTPPFIHSLAARRLIKDLEDDGATGKVPEAVWKKEVVRLGERYQLASSQTSFVAVYSGRTPSPQSPRPRMKRSSVTADSTPSSPAVLKTFWTYVSKPFELLGSNKTELVKPELMTQPNHSVPGGWPDGSEVSEGQIGLNTPLDYESSYRSCSRTTMSSLVDRSSFESGQVRGRQPQKQPRKQPKPPPPQDPTQRDGRSPSPQLHPNHEATQKRNTLQPPTDLPTTTPGRITPDVLKLVQSMSYDGSFTLAGPLADIVGQETLGKARALHTDEVLCATALSIAFLEKNLEGQGELLAALVDKGMEFVQGRCGDRDFRRVLIKARELVN